MVRVCVVNSQIPFLLSNNVFRMLGAQIDTAHGRSARCQAWFFNGSDVVGEEVVLAGLFVN